MNEAIKEIVTKGLEYLKVTNYSQEAWDVIKFHAETLGKKEANQIIFNIKNQCQR